MAASDNQPSAANSFRTVDAARGMLITAVVGFVGYFAVIPAPASGQRGFSPTHNGLLMLLVGVALQLAIIFGRPLIARFERARGMEGQISPMVIHFLQLLADGVTILLFALAVFGGITQAESSI
jgi:hypothetical protein